jgi:hypothetical protein
MKIARLIVALFALVALATAHSQDSPRKKTVDGFALVDKKGNIGKPKDFRTRYETLGTYAVLDPKGNQLHMTYASPGAVEHFRKAGSFADGTVLVKEVMGTEHAQLTTGDAHFAKNNLVWFVMVKDAKGRYPGNPLWGDGWGWALYKADAPDKQVAVDYKKDCLGCHIPAKSTGWIYTQGYPTLKGQ